MTDARKPDSTARTGEGLVDAATKFGSSLARLATAVAAVPLSVLPVQNRDDAVKAAGDLFTAVGTLHMTAVKTAVRGVETAANEFNKAIETVPPAKK